MSIQFSRCTNRGARGWAADNQVCERNVVIGSSWAAMSAMNFVADRNQRGSALAPTANGN